MPSLPRRGNPRRRSTLALAIIASVALVPALVPRATLARDIEHDLRTAAERLEVLVERFNAVRSDLAATRLRIGATTTRLDDLTERLADAGQRVSAIASWAYKTGPASQFSAILAADSPSAFMRRVSTLDDLARAQEAQVGDLTSLVDRLTVERSALSRLADQQGRQMAELSRLTTRVEADIDRLKKLRASRASRPAVERAAAPDPPRDGSAAARAVRFAYAQIGRAYQYGSDGPRSFDCSGLTMAAWRTAGVALPHNAARQFSAVPRITRDRLRPGDLVFYYGDIHHVGIYVGRGSVIHAPNTGEHVRVQAIDLAPIHGYGRPG